MHWILHRSDTRLDCYDGPVVIASFRVGIGTSETATPLGRWSLQVSTPTDDPERVAILSTPQMICLRETHALDTLGMPASGG